MPTLDANAKLGAPTPRDISGIPSSYLLGACPSPTLLVLLLLAGCGIVYVAADQPAYAFRIQSQVGAIVMVGSAIVLACLALLAWRWIVWYGRARHLFRWGRLTPAYLVFGRQHEKAGGMSLHFVFRSPGSSYLQAVFHVPSPVFVSRERPPSRLTLLHSEDSRYVALLLYDGDVVRFAKFSPASTAALLRLAKFHPDVAPPSR